MIWLWFCIFIILRMMLYAQISKKDYYHLMRLLVCYPYYLRMFPRTLRLKKACENDGRVEIELYTSTRVCRPSQLANIDTGHPPFKVIV